MLAPILHHWLADQDGWPQPVDKSASDTLSISVTESAVKDAIGIITFEDFEDSTLDFTYGSLNEWIRTNTVSHSGTWSWTNPDIADSSQADSIIVVPEGANRVKFWYKTDSEASWDYFRFFIDGVQQFQLAGPNTAWSQADYTVTPGQLLTFRFMKDGSQSVGADAAYVDEVTFEGVVGPPPSFFTGSDPANISVVESATALKALEELLYPDAILTQTNLTGSVTDIDEDPASPDANWLTGGGAVVLRVSFPTPTSNLVSGFEQQFKVRVRPGT